MASLPAFPTIASGAAHVASDVSPAIFGALHDPDVNLVVWQRTLDHHLLRDLALLDLCCVQDVRLTLPLARLDDQLVPALAGAGWPGAALAADIADLARRFAHVMACPTIELRLEVVRGDACRKFHADYVPARLVTTYLGPGTDWLPNGAQDERVARRLAAGAVGLFKGRTWPTDAPIIHRSPPIAGTGQVRAVLVINPGESASHAGTGC